MMPKVLDSNLFIPNDKIAMDVFRSIRWAEGVYCPKCKSNNVIHRGVRGQARRYSCNDCGSNFNDFTNTMFHKSKVPMGVMLYILTNLQNKSIKQLSEELDYSRVTIHKIAKKFKKSLLDKHENPKIDGEIEIDEMYISAGTKGIKKTSLGKEDLKEEEEEPTN